MQDEDYEGEDEPEGDDEEHPEPEGEDPSGSVNQINQMTMCVRGKCGKPAPKTASSSSTERVVSESHRVPLTLLAQAILAQAFWLKPFWLKNGTSVLSIHLDQVSARSIGWPLVYFFLLNCPVTCCLDPFFHLQKFFHLLPFLFNIIGPACHCGRSRLFPSSPFPTPISPYPIGPACHCGRSRHLFPLPSPHQSFPFLQARLVIVAGPAYLFPLPSPHQPLPTL